MAGPPKSRIVVRGILLEDRTDGAEDLNLALFLGAETPQIALDQFEIDPEVLEEVSAALARELVAVPVVLCGNTLVVAMRDPSDEAAVARLQVETGREIGAAHVDQVILSRVLAWVYPE